jgi:hypothetical protein
MVDEFRGENASERQFVTPSVNSGICNTSLLKKLFVTLTCTTDCFNVGPTLLSLLNNQDKVKTMIIAIDKAAIVKQTSAFPVKGLPA